MVFSWMREDLGAAPLVEMLSAARIRSKQDDGFCSKYSVLGMVCLNSDGVFPFGMANLALGMGYLISAKDYLAFRMVLLVFGMVYLLFGLIYLCSDIRKENHGNTMEAMKILKNKIPSLLEMRRNPRGGTRNIKEHTEKSSGKLLPAWLRLRRLWWDLLSETKASMVSESIITITYVCPRINSYNCEIIRRVVLTGSAPRETKLWSLHLFSELLASSLLTQLPL